MISVDIMRLCIDLKLSFTASAHQTLRQLLHLVIHCTEHWTL